LPGLSSGAQKRREEWSRFQRRISETNPRCPSIRGKMTWFYSNIGYGPLHLLLNFCLVAI
jgi:hypothetical protein